MSIILQLKLDMEFANANSCIRMKQCFDRNRYCMVFHVGILIHETLHGFMELSKLQCYLILCKLDVYKFTREYY